MASVRLRILTTGFTEHAERMALRGGRRDKVRFPATVGVIEHSSRGVVLFDTGYSHWFFRATQRYPGRIYAKLTPVVMKDHETAAAQLAAQGISPSDVRHVVLSHFHGDHIAGARDFDRCTYHFAEEAYTSVARLSSFSQVRAGFLPALLPEDFRARGRAIRPEARTLELGPLSAFGRGVDLFGDGTLVLVPLPGHATGQLGLWVREDGRDTLLVADAAWLADNYKRLKPPSRIAMRFLGNSDPREYGRTLEKLHQLAEVAPDMAIVPCHCEQTHHHPRASAELLEARG